MTNYNDGKWHGWNGGECPVHPESVVEVRWISRDGEFSGVGERRATVNCWETPCLFRVVEEHKEPREFWVNVYEGNCYSSLCQSKESADMLATPNRLDCIHVREVI